MGLPVNECFGADAGDSPSTEVSHTIPKGQLWAVTPGLELRGHLLEENVALVDLLGTIAEITGASYQKFWLRCSVTWEAMPPGLLALPPRATPRSGLHSGGPQA